MQFKFILVATGVCIPLHAQEPLAAGVNELAELVVTASKPAAQGLAQHSMQSVRTVSEATLRRNASPTLGEALGWEPGVSSGYFGPGASRPVIRGFEGVRVRTLVDDLGTFDLSDLSPDHGVAVEPFLLDRVEVHRGPASLLYGNSAIGGAVNSRSKVIARELPTRAVTGDVESRYETNGNGISNSGILSLTHGPFVLRATGSLRDSDDVSIPGRGRSEAYEMSENPTVFDPGAGQAFPVPNPRGVLPNSGHEGTTGSIGISYIPENQPLLIGLSHARFDNQYGVPYFFPGDATDLYGDYALDMALERFDLEARYDIPSGFLSQVDGRLAHGWYEHQELFNGKGKDEGRDFLDTELLKTTTEGRLDLHHRGFPGLTGIMGISGNREDLESLRTIFPPPNVQRVKGRFEMESTGLYYLETYERGEWTGRLGQRLDWVRVDDVSLASQGYTAGESDVSNSLSASIQWQREHLGPVDRLSINGVLSSVERIPTATERYAFWNNAGIGRFLVGGDLDGTPLGLEQSLGYELGMTAVQGPVTTNFTVYHYDFDNFIFLQEAPGLTGGFGRAVQYIERAAVFTGFETEVVYQLSPSLTLTLMSDFVRAENSTDGEPIPRIPPLRIGSRLEWQSGRWNTGLEIRHSTEQDRVKPAPRAELSTAAFTVVNADISHTFLIHSSELTLFLRASNLLDEEIRLATSFRKDVAPLPGRSLELGFRYHF